MLNSLKKLADRLFRDPMFYNEDGTPTKFLLDVQERARLARFPRNADGTVTTKHGDKIVLHDVWVKSAQLHNNTAAFMVQPRIKALEAQMKPLMQSPMDDKVTYCMERGEFFLESDLKKRGRDKVKVLGRFDPALEESLVKYAANSVAHHKIFHGCSRENPIAMDENGTVYEANTPKNIRGHIKSSPSVIRG